MSNSAFTVGGGPTSGTVNNIATGAGLRGGPITSAGTINLATTIANGYRLSLLTATPVTVADQTAKTTIFMVPYKGVDIDVYNGAAWERFQPGELNIAIPAAASQMYDVFLDYNAGVPALALEAWANDTTRNVALSYLNGVLVLNGTNTKRYLGSFRTTAVAGQTQDSLAFRYLWNYYNRVSKNLIVLEATATWAYTTNVIRQANASIANQVAFVIGVSEDVVQVTLRASLVNTTQVTAAVGIGLDSTIAYTAAQNNDAVQTNPVSRTLVGATYFGYPGIGYHFLAWLEQSQAAGVSTWYGNGTDGQAASGNGLVGNLLM